MFIAKLLTCGKKNNRPESISYLWNRLISITYALCLGSSETLSFLRPFFLLPEITPRPLADDIRSLKPCLFFLFLLDG
jgi:hypothetical protein